MQRQNQRGQDGLAEIFLLLAPLSATLWLRRDEGGYSCGELIVFQTPAWGDDQVGWRLGKEAVDGYVGAQTAHDVGTQGGIAFRGE